jgi:putative transposase
MVRRRRGRTPALGTRMPLSLPTTINERWSRDFVADTLSKGRRFRMLGIVDDFSRECLTTVVDTSLSGVRVVRELEPRIRTRGTPKLIVSDNGTELTSVAVLRWGSWAGGLALYRAGQAGAERFHRKLQQQTPG